MCCTAAESFAGDLSIDSTICANGHSAMASRSVYFAVQTSAYWPRAPTAPCASIAIRLVIVEQFERACVQYVCQKSCGVETRDIAGPHSGRSATSTSTVFLCRLCHENREMWKKSNAWFYKRLPDYRSPSEPPTNARSSMVGMVDAASTASSPMSSVAGDHHFHGASSRTAGR